MSEASIHTTHTALGIDVGQKPGLDVVLSLLLKSNLLSQKIFDFETLDFYLDSPMAAIIQLL